MNSRVQSARARWQALTWLCNPTRPQRPSPMRTTLLRRSPSRPQLAVGDRGHSICDNWGRADWRALCGGAAIRGRWWCCRQRLGCLVGLGRRSRSDARGGATRYVIITTAAASSGSRRGTRFRVSLAVLTVGFPCPRAWEESGLAAGRRRSGGAPQRQRRSVGMMLLRFAERALRSAAEERPTEA